MKPTYENPILIGDCMIVEISKSGIDSFDKLKEVTKPNIKKAQSKKYISVTQRLFNYLISDRDMDYEDQANSLN